ncbi:MAG: holo-ACP synthase [Hyphomicrobiales bacterium]
MIIGLGSDLCDIRRIEKTLERFGNRFVERVFTTIEQRKAESRAHRAATYAKRFAAKEACAKALGTGFSRGVFLKDIGVVNGPSGAPTLALTGGAAQRLAALVPKDHDVKIHLTLTDEAPLAMAVVVIEALPRHAALS